MDVYAEQSISNPGIDKHRKRTKVFVILRYVCIAAVLLLLFLLFVMPIQSEGNIWLQFLYNFLLCLFLAVPFVLLFIFLGKYINRTNVEFDYYLNGDLFRIVQVINRKKRKKLVEVGLSTFQSVGRVTADAYERYASFKGIKNIIAFCEAEDENDIIYIYYVVDGVSYLLHIQPDEVMLMSLRRGIPRMTVLDKSLNTPIKKPVVTESKTEAKTETKEAAEEVEFKEEKQ